MEANGKDRSQELVILEEIFLLADRVHGRGGAIEIASTPAKSAFADWMPQPTKVGFAMVGATSSRLMAGFEIFLLVDRVRGWLSSPSRRRLRLPAPSG